MIEFTRYNLPSGRETTETIIIDPETDLITNKSYVIDRYKLIKWLNFEESLEQE